MYNLGKFLVFIVLFLGFSYKKEENNSRGKRSFMEKSLSGLEKNTIEDSVPKISRLHKVEWSKLPNWENDNLEDALICFKKSLPKLMEKDPANWKRINRKIRKINEKDTAAIRAFFEYYFTPYEIANKDGSLGKAYLTSYSTDLFEASFTKDDTYKWPIYKSPFLDLNYHELSPLKNNVYAGEIEKMKKYSRNHLHQMGLLEGKELVWLKNPLDAFRIELQGSMGALVGEGKDQKIHYFGYDGGNGKTFSYKWIGDIIKEEIGEKEDAREISDEEINEYISKHPLGFYHLIKKINFFREKDSLIGSFEVERTPKRSLAVNKADFDELNLPMGIPVYYSSVSKEDQNDLDDMDFNRLGFAQDTIVGDIVRVNLFYGIGKKATEKARKLKSQNTKVYALLPKSVFVDK